MDNKPEYFTVISIAHDLTIHQEYLDTVRKLIHKYGSNKTLSQVEDAIIDDSIKLKNKMQSYLK